MDLNGDGKLDVITANSASGNVSVLTGNGAGTFTAVTGSPFSMGVAPSHVLAADLDGDGKLDLVTANSGFLGASVGLSVRKGDGILGFGNVAYATTLAQVPSGLAAADFNLDGIADVAVSQSGAQFVYLTGKGTIGAATFSSPVSVAVGTQASNILAAPFHTNTDRLYDVVTPSSNTNNLSISINVCQ